MRAVGKLRETVNVIVSALQGFKRDEIFPLLSLLVNGINLNEFFSGLMAKNCGEEIEESFKALKSF